VHGGEGIATFGLLGVVIAVGRTRRAITPFAGAAYIVGAYWFTASTSFANPAVAIARAFSDTYAGIRPADLAGFIAAELAGAASAASSSPGSYRCATRARGIDRT
jgi:glycerol uptake facilitator-like aquaporin